MGRFPPPPLGAPWAAALTTLLLYVAVELALGEELNRRDILPVLAVTLAAFFGVRGWRKRTGRPP